MIDSRRMAKPKGIYMAKVQNLYDDKCKGNNFVPYLL